MGRHGAWLPALAGLLLILGACSPRTTVSYPTPMFTPIPANTTPTFQPAPGASPSTTSSGSATRTAAASGTSASISNPVPATPTATHPVMPTTPMASPTLVPATPTVPPPTPSPAAAAEAKRIFLGYYVPYDSSSWVTLEAHADSIDYVVAQWTTVDACGNIGSRDDRTLIAFARARGIKVLPSLFTSSAWLNHRLLTEEAVTSRAIQQLVDYVIAEGYAGLDVDLEDVSASDRTAYTTFVARLSTALHQKSKLLTLALPAKTSDVTTGWGGAFDYAALAQHLDLAMIMTYAYTIASSQPGSTAPYDWVDRAIAFATSQIPPEKVLLGLAFWGYDWNTTSGAPASALRYSQAAAIAKQYGVQITKDPATRSANFTYTAGRDDAPVGQELLPKLNHDISVRSQPACPVPSPTSRPQPTATATPTPAPTQHHVVWLEDAESTFEHLAIADKYHTAGVGAWRLGQEDPAVWPLLSRWRKGS